MLEVWFTSSKTNNCRDFVSKLQYEHTNEIDPVKGIYPKNPFLLVTGTYADNKGEGTYHPDLKWLIDSKPESLKLMKGVVCAGNRVFGPKFALTGKILSHFLSIPHVRAFELKGFKQDVDAVRLWINKYNLGD